MFKFGLGLALGSVIGAGWTVKKGIESPVIRAAISDAITDAVEVSLYGERRPRNVYNMNYAYARPTADASANKI